MSGREGSICAILEGKQKGSHKDRVSLEIRGGKNQGGKRKRMNDALGQPVGLTLKGVRSTAYLGSLRGGGGTKSIPEAASAL